MQAFNAGLMESNDANLDAPTLEAEMQTATKGCARGSRDVGAAAARTAAAATKCTVKGGSSS